MDAEALISWNENQEKTQKERSEAHNIKGDPLEQSVEEKCRE